MLPSQQAAERWASSGDRFAQVTAFLPEYGGLMPGSMAGLEAAIMRELLLEGLEPHTPAGAPVFAYSAEAVLRVASEYRGPVDAYVTGVGGNFFLFHPVQLISGSTFAPDSINRDLAVIDETLAWWLFGATDVAGMELIIGGNSFLISGVYRPLQDFASQAAEGALPHMFLYYDALAGERGMVPITTIEVVLPNPISGIAASILLEALDGAGVEDGEFVFVENSARYRLSALIDVIRNFGQRSMYRTGLRLPYWENAARMAEDFAALALLLMMLLLIYPAVVAICLFCRRFQRRKWRMRDARKKLEQMREQRREAEWQSPRLAVGEEDPSLDVDKIIREVRESEGNYETES